MPILWELAPNHPNLLESYFDDDDSIEAKRLKETSHVRKPIFGREGGSVSIVVPGNPDDCVANPSEYGSEGYVVQALHPLPVYAGRHVVIGSWVIDGLPAGIGMRADASPITGNRAIFVPHYIKPSLN